jgi:two-component system nitrogen regulation sensor histidine kinase GlnL
MRPHATFEQFILDNMSTAVLMFDRSLKLVTMNSAAEALLEVSANQIRGTELGRLLLAARSYKVALDRAIEEGYAVTERELQLRPPGSGILTVDCTITPLREASRGVSVLVELIPIDRQKRITREEQLVAQNETGKLFARGLAHEIRNPLGGLRGAAQLLERELVDESLKEYTRVIISEADRLQNLIERMLGPRTLPQKRAINVHEATERVYALVRAEAPPNLSVVRDYDPSIPILSADPELLVQAILNVVRNAVQALEDGGQVIIRTRVHRNSTIGNKRHRLVVAVEVTDNGPGIPRALQETVFYPMVSGRPDGTGLGLSIAQLLITQHGGLIECISEPGSTTFTILLPVGTER